MGQDKVTSIQVAKRAGVSQSAVSRYFTPGASVSKKTAEKVRLAAKQLGYRPNVLARSLITGSSRVIGLIVAYLENQFYPDAIQRLSAALQKRGYHILVFLAEDMNTNVDHAVQEIIDHQVAGIVIASASTSSDIAAEYRASGVPIVMFNRFSDTPGVSTVTSDNIAGGRHVAEFLVAGGHQRIGYLAGWEGASTQRDREQGFREGLAAHGHQLFCRAVGNFNLEQSKAAVRCMFSALERPDAVFAANDHMAFILMDVLRFELGLRVPEDVSVVGYDDVPLAAWPSYNLTTVRQRSNLMVAETVRLLLESEEQENVQVEAKLMVRESAHLPKAGVEYEGF